MADTDLQVTEDNQSQDVPEWIPEKFKASPEKFAEAYTNLERELTQRGQREKELQQQIEHYEAFVAQTQAAQQTPQQTDPSVDYRILAYERAMEEGDYRTALSWQAQINQAQAEAAVQKALPQVQQQYQSTADAQYALVADHAWNNVKARYGDDLEENRNAIGEYLGKHPGLLPEDVARDPNRVASVIEDVYKIVTYGKSSSQSVDMTAAKLAAQSLPGAAGRPPSPDAQKAEWEAIKKAGQTDPGRYW